jgi:hypothetical protein
MKSVKDTFMNKLSSAYSESGALQEPDGAVDFSRITGDLKETKKKKKKETKEATGAGSAGGYVGPLFAEPKKVETKEATGAASAGSYEGPSFLAKSMSKKNWRGKSKTQIPGGKFVQVKKKCKTFPYCNKGDINALKLSENNPIDKAIKKISKDKNISESVIFKVLLEYFNK